jgi:hypothetical protein
MHLKRFLQWLTLQPGYKSRSKYSDAEYFNLSGKDARVATARREVVFAKSACQCAVPGKTAFCFLLSDEKLSRRFWVPIHIAAALRRLVPNLDELLRCLWSPPTDSGWMTRKRSSRLSSLSLGGRTTFILLSNFMYLSDGRSERRLRCLIRSLTS